MSECKIFQSQIGIISRIADVTRNILLRTADFVRRGVSFHSVEDCVRGTPTSGFFFPVKINGDSIHESLICLASYCEIVPEKYLAFEREKQETVFFLALWL